MYYSNASKNNIKAKEGFNIGKTLSSIKNDFSLYLLLVVPMIFLFLFSYKPMYGLIIAFKDYVPPMTIAESPWIGFDIFKEIFQSNQFYKVLRNTLILNGLDLITGFPAPIILAILLNEVRVKWFKKTSQTLLYMPYFLSWVIIAGIMYQLMSPETGLINILITNLGGTAVPFLTEKLMWVVSYNLIGIWQSAGWGTIIYLAAITGINSELYEAAVVDGAGRLRKIWHITLPGIRPTIIALLIINLGRIMGSSFDRPFTLGNAMVMDNADVIATYVYREGLQSVRYNLATAVGLFQSVVGFVLVLISNYFSKKAGEGGIF
ncbi:MAG: ABC transporter permease subunit [Clostridia bacterium]|nr:ABC transporter permease subunit [Clostridia bacterium]